MFLRSVDESEPDWLSLEPIVDPYYISSSWLKIRLHAKNQLPRLSRTALIVMIPSGVVVMVVVGFLPIIKPPQQKLF